MRVRPSRRLLGIAVALFGVVAPHRAECAIDVTGLWYLAIGAQQGSFGLVQSDGTLRAAAAFDFNFGTIDSTTGAFTLSVADVASLSCARLTGTVSADGRTLAGTATLFSTPPDCPSIGCFCSVSTDVPLRGSRAPCGNGVVDPGEGCDDGHLPPGDCCALDCTPEPAGTACPGDGDPCTDDACDGAGVCVSGSPRDCGPCAVCAPDGGCEARIRTDCAVATGHARLDLRAGPGASEERATFSWSDPAAGDPSTFGDPTRSTEYAMCVFAPASASGGGATPLATLAIPAGGTCGERPCWTASPDGFRRRDGGASPDGRGWDVTLRAPPASGTAIDVRGAGSPLRLAPDLDASSALVQVIARDGATGDDLACWETAFPTPTQRSASRFSARR